MLSTTVELPGSWEVGGKERGTLVHNPIVCFLLRKPSPVDIQSHLQLGAAQSFCPVLPSDRVVLETLDHVLVQPHTSTSTCLPGASSSSWTAPLCFPLGDFLPTFQNVAASAYFILFTWASLPPPFQFRSSVSSRFYGDFIPVDFPCCCAKHSLKQSLHLLITGNNHNCGFLTPIVSMKHFASIQCISNKVDFQADLSACSRSTSWEAVELGTNYVHPALKNLEVMQCTLPLSFVSPELGHCWVR